ncbi:MAG: AAA family ATPase, partial [Clostridiales bacterium]|nr:AAA family ATPase [Clostridiales bacterium]
VVYRFIDGRCEGCDESDDGSFIAHKRYFAAEASIKKEISGFLEAGSVLPDRKKADKKIRSVAEQAGLSLSERQLDAVYLCLYSPIAIVTGGPGTGKTTITRILAEHLKKEKISCCFCAPTGRAAKRLSEASGVKASTIHRLLEIKRGPDEGEDVFVGKNSNDPIDARVIIVDESSMVDTLLFDLLLKAIKPDSSLILIGDPDQLPSVGPGNVLSDLISCGSVPKVKLEYVFRQSDESSIASNAVRILRGEDLVGNDTDFRIIREDTDEEALKTVKELALKEKGEDLVILSPTKQNLLGTVSLNGELQELMKEKDADHIRAGKDLTLHPGDRVMQIKNNYSIEYFDPAVMETRTGVFNGEIGQVIKGDFLLGTCSILFDDGKTVIYDRKMLEDIDLSYAMTVHKAQGCEFDNVIIALGKMNYKLFSSKILYTAVTRGKKNVSIVYSGNNLSRMIKSRGDDERDTSLKDFLALLEKRYGLWGS